MIFAEGEQGPPALEGTSFITLYKPHGDRQKDMNIHTWDMKRTVRGKALDT